MSRDSKHEPDEGMRAWLDELRRALESGASPAGFERLFWAMEQFDLPDQAEAGYQAGMVGEGEDSQDEVMLAILISEALDGVDIASRYPRMYSRLLASAELRAAFLDGLELLQSAEDAASDLLPLPPSRDLSFLKKVQQGAPQPSPVAPGAALIRWQRSAQEIATLFASFLGPGLFPGLIAERGPSYGADYRGDDGFLEDDAITLLRGRLSANNLELDVTLEGLRPASRPGELQLALWVVPVDEAAPSQSDLSLLATVRWGDYEAQVDVTGDGRYELPPRKLEETLDDLDSDSGDLYITLQHKR